MYSPCGSGSLGTEYYPYKRNTERKLMITYCDHALRKWNDVNTVCVKCNGVFSFKEIELSEWTSRIQITSPDTY